MPKSFKAELQSNSKKSAKELIDKIAVKIKKQLKTASRNGFEMCHIEIDTRSESEKEIQYLLLFRKNTKNVKYLSELLDGVDIEVTEKAHPIMFTNKTYSIVRMQFSWADK